MGEVIIRHSVPGDPAAVHRGYSSPKATAGALKIPYASERDRREKLSRVRDDHVSFVARARDEVAGHLALMVYADPRRRHFGVAVRDDRQGRGVGTHLVETAVGFADNRLDLARLDLRVYADNAAVTALHEKSGFEREGTHGRLDSRDGGYVDAHVMARLKG